MSLKMVKWYGIWDMPSEQPISKDVLTFNQDHNMSRNVVFTDNYLYFITKKLHRLVQVDLQAVFDKVKSGEECPPENEEGKVLAVAVIDFTVDEKEQVWILGEDSTVEKLDKESPLCKHPPN